MDASPTVTRKLSVCAFSCAFRCRRVFDSYIVAICVVVGCVVVLSYYSSLPQRTIHALDSFEPDRELSITQGFR
jgi:hypothetical protein